MFTNTFAHYRQQVLEATGLVCMCMSTGWMKMMMMMMMKMMMMMMMKMMMMMMMMMMMVWMKMVTMVMNVCVHVDALFITL